MATKAHDIIQTHVEDSKPSISSLIFTCIFPATMSVENEVHSRNGLTEQSSKSSMYNVHVQCYQNIDFVSDKLKLKREKTEPHYSKGKRRERYYI